jgi:Kelch motif/Galactose oxidase, central domain
LRRALPLAAVALLAAGCGGTGQPTPPSPGATSPPATSAGPAGPAPAGLSWRTLTPAPSQRTEVTAAAVGGDVYLIGGYRGDGATVPTVQVYDTRRNRWRAGPDLPVAVNHAMAASVGGAIEVFGGYLASGGPSAAAFRLDGGRWRRLADLPAGRAAGTAVATGGKVYLAGGIGPDGLARTMLVFDAAANRWLVAPGPPTPREHLGGAAADGKVYTVGGRARGRGDLDAAEVFDPATARWSALAPLPTRRGGLGATATANGFVVAVGGEPSSERTTTFAEAEALDPRTGAWRSLPPMPSPRHGLGVAAIGTVVYTLAGGPRPGLHVSSAAEAIDLAPLRS